MAISTKCNNQNYKFQLLDCYWNCHCYCHWKSV